MARETHEEERSGLLTFFRWGDLKRFFLARDEAATELTFFEAAQAFECEPDARRIELPDDFYERLDRNKQAFEYSTSEEAPASSKEAPTITVSRPQATNEDLSDCAEGCPSARQPVFILAIGHQ